MRISPGVDSVCIERGVALGSPPPPPPQLESPELGDIFLMRVEFCLNMN